MDDDIDIDIVYSTFTNMKMAQDNINIVRLWRHQRVKDLTVLWGHHFKYLTSDLDIAAYLTLIQDIKSRKYINTIG